MWRSNIIKSKAMAKRRRQCGGEMSAKLAANGEKMAYGESKRQREMKINEKAKAYGSESGGYQRNETAISGI